MSDGQPIGPLRALDHIGIATTDLDRALRMYRDTLGMAVVREEMLDGPGLRAVLVELADQRIELLAPVRADTPVSRFLERRGPGLHHIAYAVDDIVGVSARLTAAGLERLGADPEPGVLGSLTCFFHPRSTDGVLLELIQPGLDRSAR